MPEAPETGPLFLGGLVNHGRSLSAVFLLALLALHLVGALVFLPQVSFHADLTVDSDQDPRVAEALIREREFPSAHPVVLVVEGTDARDRLAEALESREVPVRSAPKGQDLSDLEGRLFLSHDGAWVLYVPTQGDGQAEAEVVAAVVADHPGVRVGGEPWVRRLLDRALVINLGWLLPGALVALVLMFGLLTRRWASAVVLTLLSCLPPLGVVFLFPLAGLPFNFTTVLAPLLVLALATTYTVHIDHHLREHGPGWKRLFGERGRAVFWSAAISALGFASLWLSPLPTLRFLGLLLVVGLGLTLFWVLIAFPLAAQVFSFHRQVLAPLPLGSPSRITRGVLGLAALVSLFGLGNLSPALHWSDYLGNQTREARELAQFEAAFPAWEEATLHLSWPEEGGWLEADRWDRLTRLMTDWRSRYPEVALWSAQDAVEPSVAADQATLAEALEFLPPLQETGKLINGARSELVVRFGFPRERVEGRNGGLELERWQRDAQEALPGVQTGWSGPLYRQDLGMRAFLVGELWGMGLFYVVTFGLIAVRLRSLPRGLWAVAPALATGGFFLGLAGWLGWPVSPATALVAAACLGQSTDDGLLWSLLPPGPTIRTALAETTLLLSAGLSVLVFSSFANIAQAAVLVILSLCFSTAVVLWVLPERVPR